METGAYSNDFTDAPLVVTAGIMYTNPEDPRFEEGALAFAENARDNNLPAILVDNSPEHTQGTWVADALRERGAIIVRAEIGGIATQRLQGVAEAIGRGATKIVGVEAEKPDIPRFADKLSAALELDNRTYDRTTADVLVVGRTPESKNSMPPTQRRTEDLAGWILQQTHRLPHDSLAGPRGFTVRGAEVLAQYPATEPGMNNWIYLYKTPIDARKENYLVDGIDLDFRYPEGIVADETDNPVYDHKRYEQFRLQLSYLLDPAQMGKQLEMPQGWDVDMVVPGLDYALASKRGHKIAAVVRPLLADLTKNTPTDIFANRIATIENEMRDTFGYLSAAI
jgi:hypothetical protein